MANDLILLTGATGHLGFKVLRTTLEAGYHVRAAVRSEQKATLLKSNHVLQATSGFFNLSFIIVPDFLTPSAFDEATKDAKYIIHVASPSVTKLPENDDYDAHFIQPAVQGSLGVLESARKSRTVTRIVVTSDLDEFAIAGLAAGPVDAYGVGTQLVTGSGAPTAGLVYKLVSRADDSGAMVDVAKASKDKTSVGGLKLALRRRNEHGTAEAEIIASLERARNESPAH